MWSDLLMSIWKIIKTLKISQMDKIEVYQKFYQLEELTTIFMHAFAILNLNLVRI